jgi:hypothetical protein
MGSAWGGVRVTGSSTSFSLLPLTHVRPIPTLVSPHRVKKVLTYLTPHVQGVRLNHAISASEEVIFFDWSEGGTKVSF